MILGVGTDILKIDRIIHTNETFDDPFFSKTFTAKEREQALLRRDPSVYFATRFACKEAVFKSLGIDSEDVRLSDIEILGAENGQPMVSLTGHLQDLAKEKGIRGFCISLSYDTDYAVAFVVAQN